MNPSMRENKWNEYYVRWIVLARVACSITGGQRNVACIIKSNKVKKCTRRMEMDIMSTHSTKWKNISLCVVWCWWHFMLTTIPFLLLCTLNQTGIQTPPSTTTPQFPLLKVNNQMQEAILKEEMRKIHFWACPPWLIFEYMTRQANR